MANLPKNFDVIVAIGINVTSDVNETISYITSCNKLVINRILAPQARYWPLARGLYVTTVPISGLWHSKRAVNN